MSFSIREIICRLVAPWHELSVSWFTWRRLLSSSFGARPKRKTRKRRVSPWHAAARTRARVVDFVLYDDLDPRCLDSGIVHFDGRYFGALWDICKRARADGRGRRAYAPRRPPAKRLRPSSPDDRQGRPHRSDHSTLRDVPPQRQRSAFIVTKVQGGGKRYRRAGDGDSFTLVYRRGSMDNYSLSDSLHRLVKQAVDSGEASSIAEARQCSASIP